MIIPVLIADSHRNDDPVKAASTSKYVLFAFFFNKQLEKSTIAPRVAQKLNNCNFIMARICSKIGKSYKLKHKLTAFWELTFIVELIAFGANSKF